VSSASLPAPSLLPTYATRTFRGVWYSAGNERAVINVVETPEEKEQTAEGKEGECEAEEEEVVEVAARRAGPEDLLPFAAAAAGGRVALDEPLEPEAPPDEPKELDVALHDVDWSQYTGRNGRSFVGRLDQAAADRGSHSIQRNSAAAEDLLEPEEPPAEPTTPSAPAKPAEEPADILASLAAVWARGPAAEVVPPAKTCDAASQTSRFWEQYPLLSPDRSSKTQGGGGGGGAWGEGGDSGGRIGGGGAAPGSPIGQEQQRRSPISVACVPEVEHASCHCFSGSASGAVGGPSCPAGEGRVSSSTQTNAAGPQGRSRWLCWQ